LPMSSAITPGAVAFWRVGRPRAAAACPRAARYVTIGPGHWSQAPPRVKFVTHPIREWNGHSRHFRMIYMIFAVPHGDGNGLQRVRAERCYAGRARIPVATARYRHHGQASLFGPDLALFLECLYGTVLLRRWRLTRGPVRGARPALAVGPQHIGERKLQHVFSTETRCGPLSAGPSRMRLYQSLSPVTDSIVGKPAGQEGDAHVMSRVGYHAPSPRPV